MFVHLSLVIVACCFAALVGMAAAYFLVVPVKIKRLKLNPQKYWNGERVTDYDVTPLARTMFDAYGANCGWRTFNGREMPRWDDIDGRIQKNWKAAALAALESLGV